MYIYIYNYIVLCYYIYIYIYQNTIYIHIYIYMYYIRVVLFNDQYSRTHDSKAAQIRDGGRGRAHLNWGLLPGPASNAVVSDS